MIPGEAVLDAFVNANILVCLAYCLWFCIQKGMQKAGLRQVHRTQLQLLNCVFLVVLLAPFLGIGFRALQSTGVASDVNLNLSDMVVSYYLNGGFEMKASDLEGLIHMRDNFTLNLMTGSGLVAKAVIAIFLVGLAIGTVRLIYSVFCLYRIVSHSYGWRRFGRVRLLLSDRTLVPFSTRGIWNYYIVLPSHMLGQTHELRVSVAHELQHVRQGDLEWEIVLEALKPFFFLNPFFHAWKRQVEDLREFSCDQRVLSKGVIDVRAYCDTLLSICQNTLRRDRAFVIAVPKVTLVTADRSSNRNNRPSMLESRILSALDQEPTQKQRFLFFVISLPLVAVLATNAVAVQKPGDWSQDRLMLSTVVNLERLDEINRLSTFGRVRN